MTEKEAKRIGVTFHKRPDLSIPVLCTDCPHSTIHQTGSQLWVSCRFQDGWRSINSICNLPEGEPTNHKRHSFVTGAKPEKPLENKNNMPSVKVLHSPALAQNNPQDPPTKHRHIQKNVKSEPTNILSPMYINLVSKNLSENKPKIGPQPCSILTSYNKFKPKQVFGVLSTVFLKILDANRLKKTRFSILIFHGGIKTR